jgi:hypothetical protein
VPSIHFLKSDRNFQLSQAYEALERAMSWETSPSAWWANVLSIEMYHGLRLVVGQHGAQLSELLELRAEKKMSLITPSVTPQIEGLSDDEMSELITLCQEKKLCLSSVSSMEIIIDLPIGFPINNIISLSLSLCLQPMFFTRAII